jgi:hypothetical protein
MGNSTDMISTTCKTMISTSPGGILTGEAIAKLPASLEFVSLHNISPFALLLDYAALAKNLLAVTPHQGPRGIKIAWGYAIAIAHLPSVAVTLKPSPSRVPLYKRSPPARTEEKSTALKPA